MCFACVCESHLCLCVGVSQQSKETITVDGTFFKTFIDQVNLAFNAKLESAAVFKVHAAFTGFAALSVCPFSMV